MFQHFIDALPKQFFITLLHYRNLGGDIGRVLVGMGTSCRRLTLRMTLISFPLAITPDQEPALQAFLETFDFPCMEVTNNPVFREFSPFI